MAAVLTSKEIGRSVDVLSMRDRRARRSDDDNVTRVSTLHIARGEARTTRSKPVRRACLRLFVDHDFQSPLGVARDWSWWWQPALKACWRGT